MSSSESPSSELPCHGELEQLDEIAPTEQRPEMPPSMIDRDIEGFLQEQEEQDQKRKNPNRPTIH